MQPSADSEVVTWEKVFFPNGLSMEQTGVGQTELEQQHLGTVETPG